jgi:hypothetical protein
VPAKPVDGTPRELMEQIEAEQERLREILAGRDEALLTARPADGKWSALENVRHLIFAEQAHLGRYVPGGREWSRFALPHRNGQTQRWFREFGDLPAPSLVDVLEAWAVVHERIRHVVEQDSEKVRQDLDGNLRHLRAHIKAIQRALSAANLPPAKS